MKELEGLVHLWGLGPELHKSGQWEGIQRQVLKGLLALHTEPPGKEQAHNLLTGNGSKIAPEVLQAQRTH